MKDTHYAAPLVGLIALSVGVALLLPAASVAQGAASVIVGSDMPDWSPDGSRIAYVKFQSGRVGDIYTRQPNGKGERRLTNTPLHEDMPRWSPDGSKIAFVRFTGGAPINFHIFVMNADGTEQRQVTTTGAPNFAPTWSPDGERIAFVSTDGTTGFTANPDIFVINVDGTGRRRLTTHRGRDDSPTWSPRGDVIVFESNATPSAAIRLFSIRPDGTDLRPFTDHPVEWHNEARPAWSRDGSKLAFVTERHPPVSNSEIYLVNADGTGSRRVTRNFMRDDTPAWSPDGQQLVVSRGPALRPELYVLRADGRGARKITGVNLRFVRLIKDGGPRAGDYYTMELAVRPRLDQFAAIACYAGIGKNLLELEVSGIRRGRVRCTWFVPKRGKGKRLDGFVGGAAGGTQVVRRFSLRIR